MPFRGVPSPFVSGFKIVGKSGERYFPASGAQKCHLFFFFFFFFGGGGGGVTWTQLPICIHVGTCLPLDVHLSRLVAHAYVGQIF